MQSFELCLVQAKRVKVKVSLGVGSVTDESEVWDENSQGNENNGVGNTDVPGNSITLRRSHRTGPHVNYAELADEMESNEE